MGEESHQTHPSAPGRAHQYRNRRDEELAAPRPHRQQRSSKCFVYALLALVLLATAALAFGIAALRIKTPQLKLSSVAISSLRYVGAPPSINATVTAAISIKNNNFGPFEFDNSKAAVSYGNATIGETMVRKERVGGRETKRVSITVQVRSSGLASDAANFRSEVDSRLLKLRSYAVLRGEVHVVKIFKWRRAAQMNCTMSLNLSTQAIQNLQCL